MFTPKTPRLQNQFNVDNQDATNSSLSDSFDEDNSQSSSFDSLNQLDAPSDTQAWTPSDTLGWTPWLFRVEMRAQPLLGWPAFFAPSPGFAAGHSSSLPVSAASESSPSGSTLMVSASRLASPTTAAAAFSPGDPVPTVSTSSLSSPTSAASGGSADSSSVTISTLGSGLVFVNIYDPSCTAAFEACIVAAEHELSALFTNLDIVRATFKEANDPNSSDLLGTTAPGP
jgi:hypothetical protein